MQIPNTTGLNRKSGGAQWRDLRFSGPFLGMFFRQSGTKFVAAGPSHQVADRVLSDLPFSRMAAICSVIGISTLCALASPTRPRWFLPLPRPCRVAPPAHGGKLTPPSEFDAHRSVTRKGTGASEHQVT